MNPQAQALRLTGLVGEREDAMAALASERARLAAQQAALAEELAAVRAQVGPAHGIRTYYFARRFVLLDGLGRLLAVQLAG